MGCCFEVEGGINEKWCCVFVVFVLVGCVLELWVVVRGGVCGCLCVVCVFFFCVVMVVVLVMRMMSEGFCVVGV